MWSAFFLGWAILFWIVALLSYVLGLSGTAATTFYVANVLGVISLSLAALFVILRLATKPRTVSKQEGLTPSRLAGRLYLWPHSHEKEFSPSSRSES